MSETTVGAGKKTARATGARRHSRHGPDVAWGFLLPGGGVLAGDLAVHHAHAAGETLQRDGVLHREAAALGGAGRVQAGDELAVGVVHVAVLVGLQAAQVAQGEGASALGGVEGAVLQGEQALGALEEVGVLAGAASSG